MLSGLYWVAFSSACFELGLVSLSFPGLLCLSTFSSPFIETSLVFKFYFINIIVPINLAKNSLSQLWILTALYLLWHFPLFNLFGAFSFITHILLKMFFKSRNCSLIIFIPISKWLPWFLPWWVLKIIYWINKYENELMSNVIIMLSKIKDFFFQENFLPLARMAQLFSYWILFFSPILICKSLTLAKQVFHLLMKMLKTTKKGHIKNQWKLLHLYLFNTICLPSC